MYTGAAKSQVEPRLGELHAVILAPDHADQDLRVRRSIAVMASLFRRVNVFWDADNPGHGSGPRSVVPQVSEQYVSRQQGGLIRSLLRKDSMNARVVEAVSSADLVYIHASGITGLLFAREARHHSRESTIVFDYHDSVSYELFYQLKKRGIEQIFRFSWSFYSLLFRIFSRSVDAVVGISDRQLADLKELVPGDFPTAILPNVRAFDRDIRPSFDRSVAKAGLSFVWVGQVMHGRDLERLAKWIASSDARTRLHVFGKVKEPAVQAAVQSILGNRAVFHGPYHDDGDIGRRLPVNAVGSFLGWDDPKETGINRIASPNKYFTYVNLGLPVIVDQRLEGLAEEVMRWGAGMVVGGQTEFREAAERIRTRYDSFMEGMRGLKETYNTFSPEEVLGNFVEAVVVARTAGHEHHVPDVQ